MHCLRIQDTISDNKCYIILIVCSQEAIMIDSQTKTQGRKGSRKVMTGSRKKGAYTQENYRKLGKSISRTYMIRTVWIRIPRSKKV